MPLVPGSQKLSERPDLILEALDGTLSGTNTGDQTSIVGITGTLAEFNTALTGSNFAIGGGVITGTSSGANTGDQTSIVGITGTKAQFSTAATDGDFLFVGDVAGFTDEAAQDAVGAMVDASLVYVDATPLLTRAALTGDATAAQGSNALTIAADVVDNTKLANMAQATFKMRAAAAGTGDPIDGTAAQAKTALAIASTDVSGLGSLATASSVSLSTQATGTLQAAQEPAHTGDVTNSAGSLAMTIAAAVVSNAKLATMAANTVKANATSGVATPTDVALAASQLLGRGASGDIAAIALGSTLSMSGATMSAIPAGSTTQMQYNSAGVFAGATEVKIENNQLRLEGTTSLTAPAAGGARLVGVTKANRTNPAFLTSEGFARRLGVDSATNHYMKWMAANNSSLTVLGGIGPTAVGTATSTTTATTSMFTYFPRLVYNASAATSAVCGFRSPSPTWTLGGASASLGGFHFVGEWGISLGTGDLALRAMFGMSNVTAAPTDVEPSTNLVNVVFMGFDSADANMQIMHNDGSGNCTKVDLGATFARPSVDKTQIYRLELYSPPGTTQTVDWVVTELTANLVATGQITTNMPSTTTLLGPRGWISAGGTSVAPEVALFSMYVDSLRTL